MKLPIPVGFDVNPALAWPNLLIALCREDKTLSVQLISRMNRAAHIASNIGGDMCLFSPKGKREKLEDEPLNNVCIIL